MELINRIGVSFTIHASDYLKLQALAKAKGMNVSEYIRFALELPLLKDMQLTERINRKAPKYL